MIHRDSRHSNSTLYPHETGGNQQSMPCHDALAGALGACIDAADIAEDCGSWLFRIARGGGLASRAAPLRRGHEDAEATTSVIV